MSPTTRLTRLLNHESGAGGSGAQGKNQYDVGAGDIVDFHCYNDDPAKLRAHNLKCFGGPTR